MTSFSRSDNTEIISGPFLNRGTRHEGGEGDCVRALYTFYRDTVVAVEIERGGMRRKGKDPWREEFHRPSGKGGGG